MDAYEVCYVPFQTINTYIPSFSHQSDTYTYILYRRERSPDLKYAIGLIVKYKTCDNPRKDITGVIIGWHYKHIEPYRSRIYSILNNTKNWKLLPLYDLLNEYGFCCVSQCDIISICEEWINNSEIGNYFCKFEGTHYVPNKWLEQRYPNDAAVVREILSSRK